MVGHHLAHAVLLTLLAISGCGHALSMPTSLTSSSSPPIGRVLVTGGAGYIGSHTTLELLKAGADVVVIDNLCNSVRESLARVAELAGCACDGSDGRLNFRECELCDPAAIAKVLDEFEHFDACVHFAGLKAVGESVAQPLRYYENNIVGTLNLLDQLAARECFGFVFSSSATVYGDPDTLPIREDAPLRATNPYGRTKLFIEDILRDANIADKRWQTLILRYFNPIGAHASGRIGEDPTGVPNNLMPFVAQVCVGRREKLSIFGGDYDTPDGTGVRDYIHVVDLAKGHVAALQRLAAARAGSKPSVGCTAVNLGTGSGVSVLDLVNGMAAATGKEVPYAIAPRRPGDIATCYCDPAFAFELLGWRAELGLTEMCEDTWRWQSANPMGYELPAPDDAPVP